MPSTKQKTQKTVNQGELKMLAITINKGHETVEALVSTANSKSKDAIASAIATGERLIRVKSMVPYGSLGRWIKENCKAISYRTAQRYMLLATRKTQLRKTDNGLRQAYALVGIIKDDSVNELSDETVVTPPSPKTNPVLLGQSPVPTVTKSPHKITTIPPTIQKGDLLSRAKYLTNELTTDLADKLNIESISKEDARQILEPLFKLVN